MRAAPNLVLLPSVGSADASDGQVPGTGLKFWGSGLSNEPFGCASRRLWPDIPFRARPCHASRYQATPDWSSLADALVSLQAASLVIAPATILAQTDWLKRLAAMQIEPAAWAAIPRPHIVLAATAVTDALAVLQAEGGAYDITASPEPADTSVRPGGGSSERNRPDGRGDVERHSRLRNAGCCARWSRRPTGSWHGTSIGIFHCKFRAVWRLPP